MESEHKIIICNLIDKGHRLGYKPHQSISIGMESEHWEACAVCTEKNKTMTHVKMPFSTPLTSKRWLHICSKCEVIWKKEETKRYYEWMRTKKENAGDPDKTIIDIKTKK